jgi:hypothetical protein
MTIDSRSRSFLFPLLLLLILPLVSVLAAEEELYKPGTDVLLLNEEEFKVGGCLGGRRVPPLFPLDGSCRHAGSLVNGASQGQDRPTRLSCV